MAVRRIRKWQTLGLSMLTLLTACSNGTVTRSATAPQRTTAPQGGPAQLASDNPFRTGRTLVIAHAGGDGLFPENTLFAYRQSIALGSEVVDADVRLSADGVLVAIHDTTVDRTTNGSGGVADMSFAELAALDAGWSWERNGEHPFRGRGIGVPSIEQILTEFPTTLTTLDLKDQRVDLVAPVCGLLRRLGRTSDVYIGSDSSDQVLRFREVCPEVRTSATDDERAMMRAAREAGDTTFTTPQRVGQPPYIGSDGTKRITADYLEFSHMHDIAVLTWVVDDRDQLRELIELGVDGVYTRRPDVMVDVLNEMGLREQG
jgi:glycerophosphoryl diester phosphodiesterase